MWYYNNEVFSSEMIDKYIGFVYIIIDVSNNKKYIGKKLLKTKRKLPPLKGKTRRRIKVVETDWQKYYGSSEEVKLLVEEKGPENFRREILHLCTSKGEMSYLELFEQVKHHALISDEYYNGVIQAKIHHTHVKNIETEKLKFD